MQSPDPLPSRPELDRRERLIPAPLPQRELDHRQRLACLRLIRSENVGPVTFRELVNYCGGAEEALAALPELNAKAGRPHARICPKDRAERELEAAARVGAAAVFTIEPGYPPALAAIEPPPPLLYVQGRRQLLLRPMVGIVGARNGSAAGQKFAGMLASDVGAAGFVVVSGLARGIDAAAHAAALPAGTVAVIAGGIGNVYPPENADLQARIAEEGVVVSESPPGFVPRAQDFPRRNRLISGLSLGIVIVEAARRSGSLITARFAREQSREVFVVPGHPLDPRAEGTNALIKSREVTVVTEAADVIAVLAPMLKVPPPTRGAGGQATLWQRPCRPWWGAHPGGLGPVRRRARRRAVGARADARRHRNPDAGDGPLAPRSADRPDRTFACGADRAAWAPARFA